MAGQQRRQIKRAERAGRGFSGDNLLILIERRDFCFRDAGAGPVRDDALNSASLSKGAGSERECGYE